MNAPALAAIALLAAQSDLTPLLDKIADRAAIHDELLYRIACTERVDLFFQPEDGGVPKLSRSLRNGIVVERDERGKPREARTALAKDGSVPLGPDQEPIVSSLPAGFEPIASAFPHALAASFDRSAIRNLSFRLLPDGAPGYVLACPGSDETRLEFLDATPPRRRRSYGADARCRGRASGQMCVIPESGEIRKLAFYALAPESFECVWDQAHPFSVVEQDVVEPITGVRFPSSIVTRGRWREEAAVFRQTFTECKFFEVRTSVELKRPQSPP